MDPDSDLGGQSCEPCTTGSRLDSREVKAHLRRAKGWSLEGDRIARDLEFKDFAEALAFVDALGAIAESEGHHPDLHLTDYRNVRVELTTHKAKGLTRNDFILAAKADALLAGRKREKGRKKPTAKTPGSGRRRSRPATGRRAGTARRRKAATTA